MAMKDMIYKLRTNAKMSQEQFAEIFHVSRQSVQKWESGLATPELSKIIEISKFFGVSLDALILGHGNRVVEEMNYNKVMKPQYSNIHDWEFYTSGILTEYQQAVDEGLDIEQYKDLFAAVAKLPKNEIKKELGDVLFRIVTNAKQKEGYKYIEPSDLESIKVLRKEYQISDKVDKKSLESKIHGAWLGRVCG